MQFVVIKNEFYFVYCWKNSKSSKTKELEVQNVWEEEEEEEALIQMIKRSFSSSLKPAAAAQRREGSLCGRC